MKGVNKKNKTEEVKINLDMVIKRENAMKTIDLILEFESEHGRIVKFKRDDLANAETFQDCWEAAEGDDVVARKIYDILEMSEKYDGFEYCSEYWFYTFHCYNFDFGSIDHLPEKLRNDIRRHYRLNKYSSDMYKKYNNYS